MKRVHLKSEMRINIGYIRYDFFITVTGIHDQNSELYNITMVD